MSKSQPVKQTPEMLAKTEQASQAKAAKAEAKLKADAMKAEAKLKADEAKSKTKAEKDAAALAAKIAKEAEKQAKTEEKLKTVKVKVVMPQSNGVTRPKAETACGKIWALADEISSKIGQPVPISMLMVETTVQGLNAATTRTQYALWKTFNGVIGVVPKPAEVVEAIAA